MSLNYQMVERPPDWVSAHRECRFKYRLPQAWAMAIADDGGYAQLLMSSAFTTTVNVGDRLYVRTPLSGNNTPYTGYHIVRHVGSGTYTLETPLTFFVIDAIEVWHVLLPEVSIYKGYAVGEAAYPIYPSGSVALNSIQPRTLVAAFKPEAGINGYLDFDVSGYLKSVIPQPYKAGYNDTETSYLYKRTATTSFIPQNHAKVDIMLREQGSPTANLECQLYVANASVTAQELNRFYVDTLRPLSPLPVPMQFAQGLNQYDVIGEFKQIRMNT